MAGFVEEGRELCTADGCLSSMVNAATSSSVRRGGQQRSGTHLSCGSGPCGSGQGCGGRIPCGSLQAGSAA